MRRAGGPPRRPAARARRGRRAARARPRAAARPRCRPPSRATGRQTSPVAAAREVSASRKPANSPRSGTQHGRCVHGCAPAASSAASSTHTSSAAEPVAARQASSREAVVAWPERLTDVDRSGRPAASPESSQPARSRASTCCSGRSGRPGRDDPAAAGQALQPPGQPADVLVRADDQPGAGEQRVGERREHAQLGAPLERGVVAGLRGRVAVDERRALVDVAAPDVHRAAGDVAVPPCPAAEERCGVGRHPRRPRPGVHDRVPGVLPERGGQRGAARPVGVPRVDPSGQPPGHAAVHGGDLPAAVERVLHDRPADEPGPAQHQQPHAAHRGRALAPLPSAFAPGAVADGRRGARLRRLGT